MVTWVVVLFFGAVSEHATRFVILPEDEAESTISPGTGSVRTSMGIRVIELRGSPGEMGRAHGEQFRSDVHEFAELRLAACAERARTAGWPDPRADVLSFCNQALPQHEAFSPAVYEEFCGIAEGADIGPDRLMICNGLTDIIDLFASGPVNAGGCTSWLAAPDATADGSVLAGQTWDMHPWAERFVVALRRRPDNAPASLAVTTTGCLSLIGMNEAGIAIGNNNLTASDARVGVMYLAIIHEALAQTSLAAAINVIGLANRMSGHNYYLAGPDGEIVDVETTATRSDVITPGGAFYAHSNHYLLPELAELEASPPNRSTLYRLERMSRLLHDLAGDVTPAAMMKVMADETGDADCRICRSDPGDPAATCGAAVLSPQQGRVWATQGSPAAHAFDLIEL